MKPIIVLDGDDVILRTGDKKVEWIRANFDNKKLEDGRNLFDIKPSECSRTALTPLIGHEGYEEMVRFVYSSKGTLSIEPVEGAIEGVGELVNFADLLLISARKEKQTEATIEWCEKYDVRKYFSQINSTYIPIYTNLEASGHPKKIDICNFHRAYLFVDDDFRHMPLTSLEKLTCVLFGEAEREIPRHIVHSRDWKDNVRIAKEYLPVNNHNNP